LDRVAPSTFEELQRRALALKGRSVAELARRSNWDIPDLQRAKGWVGQLLEHVLGATSGHLPQPDFPNLGVELKTIPLRRDGSPLGSTYVCTAPLPFREQVWEHSTVSAKLNHVLWIPIYQLQDLPIGEAVFWRRSPAIEQQLKEDWIALTEKLRLGQFYDLCAQLGEYLQLRPKAENRQQRIAVLSETLEKHWIVPKGFYLRRTFTQKIIQATF